MRYIKTNNIIKGNVEIIIPALKTTCIATNNDIENLNITDYSIEDDVLDIKGNTGTLSFLGQSCSNNFIGDIRPYHAPIGLEFFDTTINKPIYRVEGKWVDATGADV